MECRTTFTGRNKSARAGFTLIEIMVATGLGVLLIAGVVRSFVFASRSMAAMGNYTEMDRVARLALDRMSQDIRQTDYLFSYASNSTTSMVFKTHDFGSTNQYTLSYTYDPSAKTLTRVLDTQTNVLLTGCTYYRFDLYQRNPVLTNGGELVPLINTNMPAVAKAVDLTWVCGRTIMGVTNNTDSIHSARVVIRKD